MPELTGFEHQVREPVPIVRGDVVGERQVVIINRVYKIGDRLKNGENAVTKRVPYRISEMRK
jgi:hypothetical protein